MRLPIAATLLALTTLTGCSLTPTSPYQAPATAALGVAIHGRTMGGQQPISGSHIYLFAAASTGYAAASTSLLTAAQTGQSDTTGAYVLSDSGGNFALPAGYACTTGAQTYLYALGGNPGAGINSAAGLLAILGNCPAAGNLDAIPNVVINEASTVAAAFALAGFAKDATHIGSSNSTQGQLGLANAFALAANLEDIGSPLGGLALTPAGNGTAPQAKINTLANILASCVNSASSTSANCNTLFINSRNVQTPTNTANAAINIAHSPANNVATLYTLNNATPAFSGSLAAAPADFSLTITYTNANFSKPSGLAVDAVGAVWVANLGATSTTRLSALGVQINNLSYPHLTAPYGVALDPTGTLWLTTTKPYATGGGSFVYYVTTPNNQTGGNYFYLNGVTTPSLIAIDGNGNPSSGGDVSGAPTWNVQSGGSFYVVNLPSNFTNSYGFAVDTNSHTWITSYSPTATGSASLLDFIFDTTTGYAGSTCSGTNYTAGSGVAIDHTNNAWVSDYVNGSLVKFGNSCAYAANYTTGGLAGNNLVGVSIDGASKVWTLTSSGQLIALTNAGVPATGNSGYATGVTGTFLGPAVDPSGNVWFTNSSSATLSQVIGVATPVVTPIASGVANNTLGYTP